MKALALGLRIAGHNDFQDVAAPVIKWLAAETDETVHVGLRSGAEWVVVAREDSTRDVRVSFEVGRRLPLRGTAAGAAIMESLGTSEVEELLSGQPDALPERALLSVAQMEQEIVRTRTRGYAVSISSSSHPRHPASIASIASAVTTSAHQPLGVVVLTIPGMRFDREQEEQLGRLVAVASDEISRTAPLWASRRRLASSGQDSVLGTVSASRPDGPAR